jgi:hypothetical protein
MSRRPERRVGATGREEGRQVDHDSEHGRLREETAKLAGAVILEMEKLDGVLKDILHTLGSRHVAQVTLTPQAPAQVAVLIRDLDALKERLERLSAPAKHGE